MSIDTKSLIRWIQKLGKNGGDLFLEEASLGAIGAIFVITLLKKQPRKS